MSAQKFTLWTLSTDESVRQPRDIDDPVYPQRVALEITGIEDHVLRLWQSRGVLDRAELDGDTTPQEGRSYVRRNYSVMDLLKLRVMAALVSINIPREMAAGAVARMESALTDEEKAALEQRKAPEFPLIFFRGEGGSISGDPDSLYPLPIRHWGKKRFPLTFTGKFAGVVVDWPAIAEFVFGKLKELDQQRVGEPA
jgi:hypothetical protein